MTIRILLLSAVLTLSGCSSEPPVTYADSLGNCLTTEDVSLLNEACQTFEKQLFEKYSHLESREAYKSFLRDVQVMGIAPDFFVTSGSKKIIERMRNTGTFEKIWIKVSEVQVTEDFDMLIPDTQQETRGEFDPYCANPNGQYLTCLKKANTNQVIADYLEAMISVPGVSPGLTAGILNESLSTEDFDDGLIRLIITIGFYYELGLLLDSR